MALEIRIDDQTSSVELLNQSGNKMKVRVDNKVYDVDLVMVETGVYSILYNNKSYNVELIRGKKNKTYIVNTLYNSYDIDIYDAETKYLRAKDKHSPDDEHHISTPMPGKVIRIFVSPGDRVKAGDTVITVAAMKMESEYKVKTDRIIKTVLVKEGDTVEGGQHLILLE